MRSLVLALVLVLVSLSAVADHKKPGKGFWKILVKPNAKWVLRDTYAEANKRAKVSKITVETYDVRKVGAADVARLRWRLDDGVEDLSGTTAAGMFQQVAVTSAGLYLLPKDLDDAGVAKALEKKPSRSDPPKPYGGTKQNEGRYLKIEGDLVCMGVDPLPGAGDCMDTCFGAMCLSETDGIVMLNGNWSPTEFEFAAASYKRP